MMKNKQRAFCRPSSNELEDDLNLVTPTGNPLGVNGEPPSVPAPPPPPNPPPQIVLPRQGMGCFAVGCLTVVVAGFIFLIGLMGSAVFLCLKAADTFTSTAPVDLRLVEPDRAQINAAEGSLDRVRAA